MPDALAIDDEGVCADSGGIPAEEGEHDGKASIPVRSHGDFLCARERERCVF